MFDIRSFLFGGDTWPYTNLHTLNLDWIMRTVSRLPEAIEKYVAAAISSISPELNPATKWLFFGDSYGASGQPWPSWVETLCNMRGLGSTDFYNLSVSGSSLSAGNWLNTFKTWAAQVDQSTKNGIRYVVLGGGINDSFENQIALIDPQMKALAVLLKNELPNATIYAAFFGYTASQSVSDPRNATWRRVAFAEWSKCSQYGVTFLADCVNACHSKALLWSDMIHPNSDGAENIARAILNGIEGGAYNQVIYNSYETISGGLYSMVVPSYPSSKYLNTEININQLFADFVVCGGQMCDLSYNWQVNAFAQWTADDVPTYGNITIDLIYNPSTGNYSGIIRPTGPLFGKTSATFSLIEMRSIVTMPSINC